MTQNTVVLHDSFVNKININYKESELVLNIISGEESDNQKINFDLRLFINNLINGEEYEHISIWKRKRNKIKELNFLDFINLVNCYGYSIYLDYYSQFAQGVMLIGRIKDSEIIFNATDVKKILVNNKNQKDHG